MMSDPINPLWLLVVIPVLIFIICLPQLIWPSRGDNWKS
jgi:hypothetical protein